MRSIIIFLFLAALLNQSCNQKSTSLDTMLDVDKCIQENTSKSRQLFASVSVSAENLNWQQSICEQERLWMAIYQHDDLNRGNVILRTKNANGKKETFFNLHFNDHKLAKGNYAIDKEAFCKIEFDDQTDEIGKVVYSGKSIQDGKLEIIERSEKSMKAQFTGIIPELKLASNRKEVVFTNVKVDFSFYIRKPFKFKF